jgi:hypothetical protein
LTIFATKFLVKPIPDIKRNRIKYNLIWKNSFMLFGPMSSMRFAAMIDLPAGRLGIDEMQRFSRLPKSSHPCLAPRACQGRSKLIRLKKLGALADYAG